MLLHTYILYISSPYRQPILLVSYISFQKYCKYMQTNFSTYIHSTILYALFCLTAFSHLLYHRSLFPVGT